jgi:predicted amidophosphoribosyltransferase
MTAERFQGAMDNATIRHDVRVLGDFVAIWCDGHHADRTRSAVTTDAAVLGVYGGKTPVLCAECEAHLAYGETRRAYCPQDPKPFCAHCETHCYRSDEAEWQREMMRYSGPKSWRKGHAIDGFRHMLEARKHRRLTAAKAPAVTSDQSKGTPS